ncbi:MAG: hypothetical protein PWQ96_1822 [Clostridia bacterium]|jgi:glutamate synthase domain-containing protein 1|nr:putative Glutamine amidotransferase class-II [Clostridiales bacterium]MDK2986178.1 hypothetical protein [Clostridia bacterium]
MLREGEVRIPSGCAIAGIMNKKGEAFSGTKVVDSIAIMHDRSNGLGGGFAAYGIYPEMSEHNALHLFYDNKNAKKDAEQFINKHFRITLQEEIPTKSTAKISGSPLIWRYFVKPLPERLMASGLEEDDYVMKCVMTVNTHLPGAFIFSSGKNMGAFKGVGYPEDIGEFFKLHEYKGHVWTAHGRFPTNTPGWWGGAHPFTLLDWSIVHNGEISSYDANRRFIEMYGYKCTLQTDTEVMVYIFDLLLRRHKLPLDVAVLAVAAPFWEDIDYMSPEKKELVKTIRAIYGNLLVNGPFSIILACGKGFVALNDRIKLRSLTAATKGDFVYVASEESAIREICKTPEKVWYPRGGEPVVAFMEGSSLVEVPEQCAV